MPRKQPANAADIIPNPDPAGLCITLFGRFAVWLGRCEVPTTAFSRRKALHLLKLIALQPGHQLHRDQALDLLWPHLTPRSAAAQLYKTIHHVRQAFAAAAPTCSPETLLELRHEVIRLTAPAGVHTDVATFEQLAQEALRTGELRLLQQAVACYKGDLLPDDRYEEWTLTRRDTLQERFIELLVALGKRWQDAGYLAEAADAFLQALARDATHEAAHRGLMWVYALQGSRARALRQYQRCVDLLAQELGVEPSLETTTLYEQILHEQVQPIQPPHALPMVNLPLLPPLVGRQSEQLILGTFLERLEHGQGGVLILEGSAGIGKTRLAQELLWTEAQRWQVLWGSAYEQEGQSPYAPVIEALRKAIRIDPTDAHLIPAELALAIPELPATAAPVTTADRVAAQSALFAGMLRFLAARAQRTPLILILDDLHAADAGTWKLFHYLARQAASMPLLLIGIRRTDEPSPAPRLEAIFSRLERQGLLHRLTLTALSWEEHQLLLEQTLDGGSIDPGLADALYRLSAGNPLFAKELIRQLATDQKIALVGNAWRYIGESDAIGGPPILPIPPSVQALVGHRLALLAPAALRLLQFVAVAGQDIPVSLLEEWLRLGEHRVLEPSLLDVLDHAVAAGLLQERGFSYCFAHPLFRAIIYQQMSHVRRRALHAQVAAGLERAFQKDVAVLPVEALAYHYLQAGNVERAAHYLILAGDRAEAVFDHDSALHHYQEAVALLNKQQPMGTERARAEIHERIGDVYRAIGDVAKSLDAYRQAINVLAQPTTTPDRDWQRTLHRKITHAAVLTPDVPTAAEHLQQAWALLGPEPLEQARLLITQALFDWHANQLEAAIAHALQALEIAEREQAPVEISQACEMLAMAHLPLGHWDEAFQYELRRQTPDWSPEIVVAVDAHLCLYQFRLQGVEPYQQARQFIERVAQQATTTGDLRCLAVCHYVLGSLALLQGKLDTAAENLEHALALHQRIGSLSGTAYTLARQAELLTVADPEMAWRHVQLGLEIAEQAAIRDHCIMMMHTAGIWNRLTVSDLSGAAELVRTAAQHDIEAAPCAICTVDRHAAIAAYHVAASDLETAAHYTEQALQLAQFAQNRLGQARLLRVQGQLHAARGETTTAEIRLAEAAGIFRELDDSYDLAQTLQIWGSLPAAHEAAQAERQRALQEAQELMNRFRTNRILKKNG